MNGENTAAPPPSQELPPDAQLLQMLAGAFVAQAVYVAAKLGIADLLSAGARNVKYLAEQTGADARSLYRVLRALASVGAFDERDNKNFSNSPISETLRSDHPRSTRDLAIWLGEEPHWRAYGELLYSVKTGKPAFDHVHGLSLFPFLFEKNKPLGDIFNRAMTSYSHQSIVPVLKAYDFSKAAVIADIAGGHGHLLAAILAANSKAEGVLFDLPAVLKGAPEMLQSYGVADRVKLVEGDIFKQIPVRADIYLLKHIIHDWDEGRCQTILRNIGTTMPNDGKVLIIEAVIPEGNEPNFGKIVDLEMLITAGGVERTPSEFEQLLADSGLKLNRIVSTMGPISIVEATKL